MKKKIILLSIVICLIAIEGISIYVLFKPTKKNTLEDIKVIDLKNNNSIAIMVQDTNTDEWHEADNRDSWPDPNTHGFVGAECSDSEGTSIDWEKVLTFNLVNQTATIKTKQTAYCTLYFAKGEPALDWLGKKGGATFAGSAHTTVVDGMYRFVGTTSQVLNNYICFGTTIESECLKKPETYMYRIIGVTSAADSTIGLYANQLKIIKATPSSESQVWDDEWTTDIKWDSSDMKTYLNDTFYNATFVTEATRISNASYWDSIILNHKWYIKDQPSIGVEEPKDSQYVSDESKIGLMYGTDYYNAGEQNTNNWLYIKNGWSTNSSLSGNALYEWTITRYGTAYGNWREQTVNTSGRLEHIPSHWNLSVRPVFYLQSGVNLMGEGTKEHPYIITTKNNA